MGLISRLFGSRKRGTTVQNPLRIGTPTVGFLNLCGSDGEAAMKADQQLLQPLFREVRESRDEVPQCAVLFLYGDLDAEGKVAGRNNDVRSIIKAAGAYIAVIASENPPDHYMRCLGRPNDWTANIVLTIDRKGDKLPTFFVELFRRMYAGTSMLVAWGELAPQIPGHDNPDAPSTIMAAEAGHLVFGSGG